MRAVWQVFLMLLFLHLAIVVGFGAWLWTSGRINKERLTAAYALFQPTIEAERAEAERLAAELADERQKQEAAARLEAAKSGEVTLSDRMAHLRESDETSQLKLDRLERAKADIQGQIERAQAALAEQSARLDTARADFDRHVAARTAQMDEEDFRQAVDLLATQKPKQAKAMLRTMLADGQRERVVDYLAALDTRVAGKILAEFKEADEVEQATDLLNALRARGTYTTMTGPTEGGNGA